MLSSVGTESEFEESKVKQQDKILFTKLQIIKNLVIISLCSFLSFCAYDGLSILQSTINRKDGVGVVSVSIQYGFGCIAALLFTKYFIKKFGCKTTITVTSFSYVLYIAANFYPEWFVMIPASVIVGLASSLFWAALCAYLNGLSTLYAGHLQHYEKEGTSKDEDYINDQYSGETVCEQSEKNYKKYQHNVIALDNHAFQMRSADDRLANHEMHELGKSEIHCKVQKSNSGERSSNVENLVELPKMSLSDSKSKILESTTARIFGFHGLIFQTCHIWSNLLSFYVLQIDTVNNHYINNSTCMCGADFCNYETDCFIHNLQEPGDSKKYTLLGAFLALSMLSVFIVMFFLDELEKNQEGVFISFEVLLASFRHMKNKFQILLIPLTVQIGVAVGFFMGDYTKAYIGCAWGVQHVGLVTISWGAALAVSCTLSGWLVKRLGRIPIFLIGEASILAAGFLLLTVYPDAEKPFTFFVISGLFGATIGIFWSQGRAFYGILFKDNEEVAFGNYQIFHSLGTCVAFGYSNYLCTSVKIYILLAFSIIGFIGYLLAERNYSHRLPKSSK